MPTNMMYYEFSDYIHHLKPDGNEPYMGIKTCGVLPSHINM